MTKRVLLGAAAVLLVIAAAYASFFVAPEERTMGLLQRIFYFHVSCAWAGLTAFSIGFLCNLLYVWKRKEKYDWLGVTCAEVGLVVRGPGLPHFRLDSCAICFMSGNVRKNTIDRKSTRLNSSHIPLSRMPSS